VLKKVWKALHVHFLPSVPQRIEFFDQITWESLVTAFEKGKVNKAEIYTAASLLLFDAGLYVFGYYKTKDEPMFTYIADMTREIDAPPLCIAHCIRDTVYTQIAPSSSMKSNIKFSSSKTPFSSALSNTSLNVFP
jgi:hypothetical protein